MVKIPKTGVTISAVANALGTTSTDLGTLCTHENVNIWAKFKPFHAYYSGSVPEDYKKTMCYGIAVSEANTIEGFCAVVDSSASDGENGIRWNKPRGGQTSPYRLGDFAGYNSEATPPIQSVYRNGMTDQPTSSWVSMAPVEQVVTDETCYTKEELYYNLDSNGNQYPLNYGIAIRTATTASPKFSVGGIAWNDSGWDTFKGKQCYVYEFLTNLPSGTTSTRYIADSTDRFWALPECRHRITFGSSSPTGGSVVQDVTVSASLNYLMSSIRGTVTVSSKDTSYTSYSGGTFAEVTVYIYQSSSSSSVITSQTFSNVTVGTEESKALTANISVPSAFQGLASYYYVVKTKDSLGNIKTRTSGSVRVPIVVDPDLEPIDE